VGKSVSQSSKSAHSRRERGRATSLIAQPSRLRTPTSRAQTANGGISLVGRLLLGIILYRGAEDRCKLLLRGQRVLRNGGPCWSRCRQPLVVQLLFCFPSVGCRSVLSLSAFSNSRLILPIWETARSRILLIHRSSSGSSRCLARHWDRLSKVGRSSPLVFGGKNSSSRDLRGGGAGFAGAVSLPYK
jgi:hypothetical protein